MIYYNKHAQLRTHFVAAKAPKYYTSCRRMKYILESPSSLHKNKSRSVAKTKSEEKISEHKRSVIAKSMKIENKSDVVTLKKNDGSKECKNAEGNPVRRHQCHAP